MAARCDFCSGPSVRWTYRAHSLGLALVDVETGEAQLAYGSWGAWAACDECSTLIEEDDRDGLFWRAFERMPSDPDLPARIQAEIGLAMRDLQGAFFDARVGPRLNTEGWQIRCPHPSWHPDETGRPICDECGQKAVR